MRRFDNISVALKQVCTSLSIPMTTKYQEITDQRGVFLEAHDISRLANKRAADSIGLSDSPVVVLPIQRRFSFDVPNKGTAEVLIQELDNKLYSCTILGGPASQPFAKEL